MKTEINKVELAVVGKFHYTFNQSRIAAQRKQYDGMFSLFQNCEKLSWILTDEEYLLFSAREIHMIAEEIRRCG